MQNYTLINNFQLPSNYTSLQEQYIDVCGQINFYLHDTIKLFILIGFGIFILYMIASYLPKKYPKITKEIVDSIFRQVIEIYAVSCILFFVIQVTLI